MRKTVQKLTGTFYFDSSGFPFSIRRVEGKRVSHAHDFTGVVHSHDFIEIVIICDGVGEQIVDGAAGQVCAGDVFIMQNRMSHGFPDYRSLKIVNVMFARRLLRGTESYFRKLPGYHVIFRGVPGKGSRSGEFRGRLKLGRRQLHLLLELVARAEEELQLRHSGFEVSCITLLYGMILLLARSFTETPGNPAEATLRIGRLLSELETGYAEKWSLPRMARSSSMSVSTLLRVFRNATGTTPVEYLLRLRLENAKAMLAETSWPIGEVALRCGFHDSNYFSRKFAERFRLSPRCYRKNADLAE